MSKSAIGAGFAAIFAVASLVACGPAAEEKAAAPDASAFTQVAEWNVTAEGAVMERRGEELITLIPSSAIGYQANHEIPVAGRRSLVIRYDATAQGGAGALGVLSGDRSRWLRNMRLLPDTRVAEEVTVPLEGAGDSVFVVLQTRRNTPQPTAIIVHDLQYSLQ